MSNSWKEIPNVNKDFSVAHDQQAAQKLAREEAERQREAALAQIKDKGEREKIEKLKEQREKETARAEKAAKDAEKRKEDQEIQRRIDAQRHPQDRHEVFKSVTGKSPDVIEKEVRDQNESVRNQKINEAKAKQEAFHDKGIDKALGQALERQQQQERGDLSQGQSFQKDAEKSARDRFDGAAKAKDWRQVQAERMRDEFEKGR